MDFQCRGPAASSGTTTIGNKSGGAVAGITVGSLAAVSIVVVIVVILLRRKSNSPDVNYNIEMQAGKSTRNVINKAYDDLEVGDVTDGGG